MSRLNLLGLPDELLLEFVRYAVTTDEAVNLGPETMRQDVLRIHHQLMGPLQCCAQLYRIAMSEFRKENLTYRLHMEHVSIQQTVKAPAQGSVSLDSESEEHLAGVGMAADVDLFFRARHGLMWIGTGAQWIKHLELIMPVEPRSVLTVGSPQSREARFQHMFAHVRRAFPLLESLLVRVTIYRVGEQDGVIYDPLTLRFAFVSDTQSVVALRFYEHICHVLSAITALRFSRLKAKHLVLFQEPQ